MTPHLARYVVIGGLLSFTGFTGFAHAEPVTAAPQMTIYKDPTCGCCEGWADHMKAAGFNVTVRNEDAMDRIKEEHGVNPDLASCHTAVVDGYVIEGHVPAGAVKRLLVERPQATGLTAPGMPMGSPGMEMPGSAPDTYDVLLFNEKTAKPYARYRGTEKL
ncbi:hypothetical protein FHS76_001280 [Ochrobactrum daejeonense]|uniref:Metal-binding protein n=1 Tax=Brucella daejeonensis TaxID=659015 RepID=A0A7W9EKM2_9HYPH|nr:DUF411 domain-containing protein [Brucella daejeonensis]MBB5701429.1 hypothetical protein [Brucella daejeonensis]